MKKLNYSCIIFIIAILCSSTIVAFGSDSNAYDSNHKKWFSEIREAKKDFLIKEMSLTKEQQEKFLPLYGEMEENIYKVNKESSNLEKSLSHESNVTDQEYKNVAQQLNDAKLKEAQIESDYFYKFSDILNGKQLFQLKRAESRFTRYMLDHFKGQPKR